MGYLNNPDGKSHEKKDKDYRFFLKPTLIQA